MIRGRLPPQAAHGHREPRLPSLEVCHASPQEVGECLHGVVVKLLQGVLVAKSGCGP